MRLSIALGGLSLVTAVASAQTPQVQAATAPRVCKMHVWASPHIQNDISGIFPGGALGAAETKGYRDKLKRGGTTVTHTLVTNDLLMRALKESNLGTRLNVPLDNFVLETDPEAQRSFRKTLPTDAEGCRYAFTIQIVQFEKSAVYGRQLTLFYAFTDRTARPKPRTFNGYNSEGLKGFDPTLSDEQISVILKDGVRRIVDDIVAKKLR